MEVSLILKNIPFIAKRQFTGYSLGINTYVYLNYKQFNGRLKSFLTPSISF